MSKYLQQWREKIDATEEIELSIGPAVIRSHVSLLDLAAAGRIPQTLLLDMQGMGKRAKGKAADPEREGMENLSKMLPALDALAIAAFVDPPLTAAGDADSLPVTAVPTVDKITVFNYLNRGAEALRPFRDENEPAGASRNGDDVSHAAVDVVGAEAG